MNNVEYSTEIEQIIISNLDGWIVIPDTETNNNNSNNDVDPFMTSSELNTKSNKTITRTEARLFYEEALDKSLLYTNRFNIDDLSIVEAKAFIRAVCKWTASNLWNKYNIRVNNEGMEDTYVQSYGGLLYHNAVDGLKPFINQRISGVAHIREADDGSDDIWIV